MITEALVSTWLAMCAVMVRFLPSVSLSMTMF